MQTWKICRTRGTFLTGGVLAVGVLGVLGSAAGTAMGQAVLDTNLVVNPGFELGPASPDGQTVVAPQGWISVGNATVVPYGVGSFPGTASPGPTDRGTRFLAGGPNNSLSQVVQSIDLTSLGAQIDANNVNFLASAWLGGNGSQDDLARMVVVWADANSNSLRTDTLVGPSAQIRGGVTGLQALWTSSRVPVNTRQVLVTLTMSRVGVPYNDGYVDNVGLVLTSAGPVCDSIDFNNDGSSFDPQDIEAFLSVYAEGGCIPADRTCNDIDFNNDSSVFDPCDIASFLTQYAEGPCSTCGV